MKKHLAFVVSLLISVLPSKVKRFVLNNFWGHEIHKTAYIGLSFVQAKKIKLGAGARIRNFNFIRNIELLELGENAFMDNHNHVDALPLSSKIHFLDEKERFPALIIGRNSYISGRHFFDCNDTLSIGAYTTLAGQDSLFYTHGINTRTNKQECKKLSIGNYCMVATRCVALKGAVLPDYSILGANSTLHKAFNTPYRLYSGVPAVEVRTLNADQKYFHRNQDATPDGPKD